MITFDKILPNNKLWAVRYDGKTDNALQQVFNLVRSKTTAQQRYCWEKKKQDYRTELNMRRDFDYMLLSLHTGIISSLEEPSN